MMWTAIMIVIWIVFVAWNILIAEWNHSLVLKAIQMNKPDAINHPLWAFIYCATCAAPLIVIKLVHGIWDPWIVLSILPLHLSVFPVMFNFLGGHYIFNLSKTTTAWTDRTLVKLGFKDTMFVNIFCFLLSIGFLIISIVKG